MKYTIARHKYQVARVLMLGWVPQAIQAHKFMLQNEKQIRERALSAKQNPDTTMINTRKEVLKSAADFLTMGIIKYDEVPYHLRRIASLATQRVGRCRILLGGLEATLSVK